MDNEGLSLWVPCALRFCLRQVRPHPKQSDRQNEESRNGWLPQHEVCMTAQKAEQARQRKAARMNKFMLII